jgi:hypothetical protein
VLEHPHDVRNGSGRYPPRHPGAQAASSTRSCSASSSTAIPPWSRGSGSSM